MTLQQMALSSFFFYGMVLIIVRDLTLRRLPSNCVLASVNQISESRLAFENSIDGRQKFSRSRLKVRSRRTIQSTIDVGLYGLQAAVSDHSSSETAYEKVSS